MCRLPVTCHSTPSPAMSIGPTSNTSASCFSPPAPLWRTSTRSIRSAPLTRRMQLLGSSGLRPRQPPLQPRGRSPLFRDPAAKEKPPFPAERGLPPAHSTTSQRSPRWNAPHMYAFRRFAPLIFVIPTLLSAPAVTSSFAQDASPALTQP